MARRGKRSVKIAIIIIMLVLIPLGILYAEKGTIKTEEDALAYVYSLSETLGRSL